MEMRFESRAWSLSPLPPSLLSQLVLALVRVEVFVLGLSGPEIQV